MTELSAVGGSDPEVPSQSSQSGALLCLPVTLYTKEKQGRSGQEECTECEHKGLDFFFP